jgi:hypothetical protein
VVKLPSKSIFTQLKNDYFMERNTTTNLFDGLKLPSAKRTLQFGLAGLTVLALTACNKTEKADPTPSATATTESFQRKDTGKDFKAPKLPQGKALIGKPNADKVFPEPKTSPTDLSNKSKSR